MQSYTINLSEIQASYILPLLDDLHISYAPSEKDFIAQVEKRRQSLRARQTCH